MSKSPFLEAIRQDIRARAYSIRTEKTYLYWIRYFIHFHNKKHPAEMGVVEVEQFLTHLACHSDVAVNTQKVALNSLAFLYNHFLKQPLGEMSFRFSSKQRHLPSVLSSHEVNLILRDLCTKAILSSCGVKNVLNRSFITHKLPHSVHFCLA